MLEPKQNGTMYYLYQRALFLLRCESFLTQVIKIKEVCTSFYYVYVNIKVSEEIVLPFSSEKITVQNKFPIFMSLVNGNIPNYYIGGFSKNSNIY